MSYLEHIPASPNEVISSSTLDKEKPSNILIFSDSTSATECIKEALESILEESRYTIHILNFSQMISNPWLNESCLLIVHGNVPPSSADYLINFIIETSGSLLCLCSDFLGSFLPIFHTTEVRPNELVQCYYKHWKHVLLVHHVLCYQMSSSKNQFSLDDQLSSIPDTVYLKDRSKKCHEIKIEILGCEETWHTPCFLLVSNNSSKVVFSQVHLELDPGQYGNEQIDQDILEKNNATRLEIVADLLENVLGLQCSLNKSRFIDPQAAIKKGMRLDLKNPWSDHFY